VAWEFSHNSYRKSIFERSGIHRAQPRFWRRRTKKGMHSRDRYLIFVLAARPAARFFSLFGTRSSNLLGNFAQRFYYEESLSAREKSIFSFPLRETLFLPSARKRAAWRAVKRVAFMRRAKVSGEKPRSRAVLSLKSASELSLAQDPTRARTRLFFFFCGARSDSSGLSLSLPFRSPLFSSLPLFLLARRSSRLLFFSVSVS